MTPVSASSGCQSIGRVSVRSKIHRGADVRTVIGISGCASPRRLRTSISRAAWPKPCPEMYQTITLFPPPIPDPCSECDLEDFVQPLDRNEGHALSEVPRELLEIDG